MSDSGSLTGRFATFTAHILATASTPLLGPAALLLANPIADLFKGLAGDHAPRFSNDLMRRLRGLDASKLNHDVQKALLHALNDTKHSLIFVYEHPDGKTRTLPKKERTFLDELFDQLETQLKKEAGTSSSLAVTDGILGNKDGASESSLLGHARPAQEALRRNAKDMADIVDREFERHFQLHFSEFIKDKKNNKALVAYEQLTARAMLDEVRSIRATISTPSKAKDVPVAELQHLQENIAQWMQRFPDPESLGQALHPAIETNLKAITAELAGIRTMLDSIGDRTVVIEKTVGHTGRAVGLNVRMTLVVLLAVLGVGAFFVVDPLHLRSFRVKVEIDGVHDYGKPQRKVERIAIEYGNGTRDTVAVVEGFASFRIPDEYRNDDASLRLLCQGAGQSSNELAVCDSQTVRLTDQDRVKFPRETTEQLATDKRPVVPAPNSGHQPRPRGDNTNGEGPAIQQSKAPPCALDGMEFVDDGALENRLTLAGSGQGKVSVSGEVNRKPIDGQLRVNGSTLTAIPGTGSLKGGTIALGEGCRQLRGQLVVLSPSGVQMTVAVSMLNSAR